MIHEWEEPCIAGKTGAGAVFFSRCNLRCSFCQNYEISNNKTEKQNSKELSVEKLAKIFLNLQNQKAATLDLVTPTHFAPLIIDALITAKNNGLNIPVVYNTGCYERPEIIAELSPFVDVFLPDFKYFSPNFAKKYSLAADYVEVAKKALIAMFEAKGKFQIQDGVMKNGVLVRHLILPGLRKDSMNLLKWLYENFGDDIYLSLMNQYTPTKNSPPELNRKLTTFEYESVVDFALTLGFKNAYIQEKNAADKDFIPIFDGSGL